MHYKVVSQLSQPFFLYLNSAIHNSITGLCRALFKYKKGLRSLNYNLVVHSNEMACRNRGFLELEPVIQYLGGTHRNTIITTME